MSEMVLKYAESLTDVNEEKETMIEYASIVLQDSVEERKNTNLIKREKHLKYKERNRRKWKGRGMKGYYTSYAYFGYVNGVYMQFASETDYKEYLESWKWGMKNVLQIKGEAS